MCLAVPGKILSVTGSEVLRSATVSFGGTCRQVNLAFVPEANTGDYVMVHVGFALSVVDEIEAKRTLKYLQEMGEVGGDERSDMKYVDEFRDREAAEAVCACDSCGVDAALDVDGGLRRADAHHREIRHRRTAAETGHVAARARLSGLRHAPGIDRQGHRDCRPPKV